MLEVLKNEEFNMEEQAVEGYDCLNDWLPTGPMKILNGR